MQLGAVAPQVPAAAAGSAPSNYRVSEAVALLSATL